MNSKILTLTVPVGEMDEIVRRLLSSTWSSPSCANVQYVNSSIARDESSFANRNHPDPILAADVPLGPPELRLSRQSRHHIYHISLTHFGGRPDQELFNGVVDILTLHSYSLPK